MGETEETKKDFEYSDCDKIEEEGSDCEHEWEEGACIKCFEVWEPDDFSGATEGDR